MSGGLFNPNTVVRLCKNVELSDKQTKASKKWLELLKQNKLEDEKPNYIKFAKIVLDDILGYETDKIKHEQNNVEFQYQFTNGKTVCFETKGTKTKDLFARQHYAKKEQSTPIKQLWGYMADSEFGICTNYKNFVLVIREKGLSKYHEFDFETIDDESKLKEFVGIFSKERIEKDFVTDLHFESYHEEKEFTEEFYKLFHETRLMLIKEFQDNGLDKSMSIHITQIFLNRLIFVFFVEDGGFITNKTLFHDRVIELLKPGQITEHTRKIYGEIMSLFVSFDKGSDTLEVPEFNGGLFSGPLPEKAHFNDLHDKSFFSDVMQKSKIVNMAPIDEHTKDIVKRHPCLNPIISNLLTMESFDFNTEVNVNILGHIFEQSISDIEKLQGNKDSERKKDGVYYTPEYITDYICRNTIIPYLSKSNKVLQPHELVDEYDGDIETLEKRFMEIKILDPACGSGAFLIKAAEILLEIYKEIQNYKQSHGKYTTDGQYHLRKWNEEVEIRAIIEANIFGVDKNRQSVEITKLAIFIKTASQTRKLPYLSNNIKVGNSVVYEGDDVENAFDWKKRFPEILSDLIDENERGFDVIIGNPPYVRYQDLEYISYMKLPEPNTLQLEKDFTIPKYADLSAYFFYHSMNILRRRGMLGFISSDSWMHSGYGLALQEVMLDTCAIKILMRTEFNVFEDADVRTVTTILEKTPDRGIVNLNYVKKEEFVTNPKYTVEEQQSELNPGNWNLYFFKDSETAKVEMVRMEDMCTVKIGKLTGCDSFFVLSKEVIDRYGIPNNYLVPTISKNNEGAYLESNDAYEHLLSVDEPKGKLQKTKNGRIILEYIRHGENTTITPSVGKNLSPTPIPKLYNLKDKKIWYSLSLGSSPPIWVARFADRQIKIFENRGKFQSTRRNIGVTPNNEKYTRALLAYMRSSFFALQLEKHGHNHGAGVLEIRVGDYRNIDVPNFDKMKKADIKKMVKAWKEYRNDLNQEKIDNIIFDVLGFTNEKKSMLEELKLLVIQRRESKKKTSK